MTLRRSGGLKRTPLNRGTSKLSRSPLEKRSPLKSRVPIKWRSEKTKQLYVERRKLVESTLTDRPLCEACAAFHVYDHSTISAVINPSEHLHEIVLRSQGGSILDTSIIVVVCATCHSRVDAEPLVAEMLGLYLRGHMYDKPHVAEARRVLETWSSGRPTTPYYLEET